MRRQILNYEGEGLNLEKNKMMFIIIIVLLVILLGAIAFGGFFLYQTANAVNGDAQEVETVEEEKQDKSKNTLIDIGEPISTNLLVGEDQKEHIARVSLNLDIKGGEDDSEKVVSSINTRLIVVRDIVNNILRKKTYEELKKNDGMESLKDEILDKVRKEFDTNLVSNIYISDIFLQ